MSTKRLTYFSIYIFFVTVSLGTLSSPATNSVTVNQQALISPGKEWLNYGRTYKEQRYSPLAEINKNNVNELDLAYVAIR